MYIFYIKEIIVGYSNMAVQGFDSMAKLSHGAAEASKTLEKAVVHNMNP